MAVNEVQHLAVLKAAYDYTPQSDDEIQIKEDQILFLLEKVDEDWWRVKIKSDDDSAPSGLVPAAYVEQAEHSSVVKALYDYEAVAPGELTVSEDEILLAFDAEDEWLLVQSTKDGGKAGYVPTNYVEPHTESEEQAAPAAAPAIVVPPSPPRPVSTYVDPADRVASSKLSADDIKTWSVSEVDKKGKKTKGTLGIGNGSVFFASESSKAAVQKWSSSEISDISIEKSKHVHFDVGGATPTSLHFNVGSKDNAEAISEKLKSSRDVSTARAAPEEQVEEELEAEEEEEPAPPPARAVPPALNTTTVRPTNKPSVHFSPASPAIIPPREPSLDEDDGLVDEETAVALYDFKADGDDELTVAEGEQLLVIEKDGDEWWKCRNVHGAEGVVPASYIELVGGGTGQAAQQDDDEEEEQAAAAAAAQARQKAEAEAAEAEQRRREEEERERKEKEKKRRELEERARAAEEERKKRMQAAAVRKTPSPSSPPTEQPRKSTSSQNGAPPPSGRGSMENGRPPADKVRVWHDRTGQFRVDAAFLGFKDGKLRLHKTNGVIVEVPQEKMSAEDMRYVEKLTSRRKPSRKVSDDDIPLALQRQATTARAPPQERKKGPTIDWFDFFLNAGCEIDDCTRYAASFERDKIDVSILGDITESTMRSLGLREGDIIRVKKAIDSRKPPREEKKRDDTVQIASDETLARQLEADERAGRTKPAPQLFSGPGGALKQPRRGRPKLNNSLPPSVDLITIDAASDSIQRTSSPSAASPVNRPSPTPVQAPPRASSALATTSGGFDDDAWTPRNKPESPAPAATVRAPSAPPAAAPVTTQPTAPPSAPASAPAPATSPNSLAKTSESDIFEQLARLSELRKNNPAAPSPPVAQSPAVPTPPNSGFQNGLGMGSSPSPMGQHVNQLNGAGQQQPQPTGFQQPYNGPRGPFAPVPINQSLLQPLVPTQTGFAGFIPARASANNNVSPFSNSQSPFANPPPPPQQPSFLQSHPTGFPMMSQPTGMPFGGGVSGNFGGVASNPTGFNPGFGASPFSSGMSPPPPLPTSPLNNSNSNNTNPANVFAQMKSGTFANDESDIPQPSEKYDALRPAPPMQPQMTGWGGFQGSYMGYR